MAPLEILASETKKGKEGCIPTSSLVPLSPRAPQFRDPLVYIGQPGRDDLESTRSRPTEYNLVKISEGIFRGMIPGADPAYNTKIDTLKHDVRTFRSESSCLGTKGFSYSQNLFHDSGPQLEEVVLTGIVHGRGRTGVVLVHHYSEENGTLIGLHSSWDDRTTLRHGIPLIAVERFVQQYLHVAAVHSTSPSVGS